MPVETYSLSVLFVYIDFAGLQFFYGIRNELPADALSPPVIIECAVKPRPSGLGI